MSKTPLLISLILSVCPFGIFLYGQDINFPNPHNSILYYLDTVVTRSGQVLNIYIGPEHKQNPNTIFFNQVFSIDKSKISAFRIKGSFLQRLVVDSTQFDEESIIIDSTAFDTLFITQSFFKKTLLFRDVQIQNFKLTGGNLPDNIVFSNCEISSFTLDYSHIKSINFINCTLGNINFEGSTFAKPFNLTGNRITGEVRFDYCTFTGLLHLASLRITPQTTFSFVETIMPDTLDFCSNPALNNFVDLSMARLDVFNRKCKLFIQGTDLAKLRLNYNYFELCFPKNLSVDEKENLYEGLLQNFKINGYQQSYQVLDIEYRRFQAKQGTFGIMWWIPDLWWEYGYNKARVFTITFWTVLLLTLINYFMINHMVTNVYAIGNIPAYYRKWCWGRLWFSFVYTCIIFFSLSLKIDKIKFQHRLSTLYLMVIYVFGIICLAYMANYIIQP